MKNSIFLGMFLLINTFVFSNDSSIVYGESVEIIDNETTNIAMLEEEIIITLYKDHYEVDVTFDFFNDGPSEDILLGFPVYSSTYDNPEEREWAQIDFESYINGNLLTNYTVREESEKKWYLDTMKWYIREVTFPQNSHTYSRVIYKAPYSYSGFHRFASYIFGTGRCWKGPIGKMTIYINHGDDVIIDRGLTIGYWEDIPVEYLCEASGKYKFVLENVEPKDNESITIYNSYFDIYGEYEGGFGEFYSGWIWDDDLLYKNVTELKFFTLNQIRLFIGFFYTKYGYDFQNPLYVNYFKKLSPQWYTNYAANKKVPAFTSKKPFTTKMFNKIERKNVNYLLNLEKITPFEGSEFSEEPYPVPANKENINFQFKVTITEQTKNSGQASETTINDKLNSYKNALKKTKIYILLIIMISLMIISVIGILAIIK